MPIHQFFCPDETKKNKKPTFVRTGHTNGNINDLQILGTVLYEDDKEGILCYGDQPEELELDESGERHGKCVQRDQGCIVLEREYKHGKRHGVTTSYFNMWDSVMLEIPPPILYQTHYKDGKKHGNHILYDRWGNVSASQEWKEGKLVKTHDPKEVMAMHKLKGIENKTMTPQNQTRYGYTGAICAEWREEDPQNFTPTEEDKRLYYDRYNIKGRITGELKIYGHTGKLDKVIMFDSGNSQSQ